jgi:hypothetical protein
MFTHRIDDVVQMKIIRSLSLSLAVFLALQLVYAQVPGETVQPQPSAFEQKVREVLLYEPLRRFVDPVVLWTRRGEFWFQWLVSIWIFTGPGASLYAQHERKGWLCHCIEDASRRV